jgi:hypothetical protein
MCRCAQRTCRSNQCTGALKKDTGELGLSLINGECALCSQLCMARQMSDSISPLLRQHGTSCAS